MGGDVVVVNRRMRCSITTSNASDGKVAGTATKNSQAMIPLERVGEGKVDQPQITFSDALAEPGEDTVTVRETPESRASTATHGDPFLSLRSSPPEGFSFAIDE